MANSVIAIMYDFDKTLSPGDMQEYGFIPSLDMSADEFWTAANNISIKHNMDRILSYMYLMIKTAKKKDIPVTKESFIALGRDVKLMRGVKGWFKRINDLGKALGLTVEHYILSSGLKEIIEGTPIAKEFKEIYACEFHYNERGNADWPQQAVNYTTKTQFIFRISKGVLNVMDDYSLNVKIKDEERRVPYRNMIYVGDGLTDVPCMKLVKLYGGHSIAIYHPKEKRIAKKLLSDGRVNFICRSDYSEGSEVEEVVKMILNQVALTNKMIDTAELQSTKVNTQQ